MIVLQFLYLSLLGALANARVSRPVTMPLFLFPTAEAQANNAICNDGSPAGFYFRKGSNPKRWVIHLQGGGWCYDEPSCIARMQSTPGMMSSKAFPSTYEVSGVFSQDSNINPHFHDATYMYIPYCTSDSFSGSRNASAETFGWHFQGKAVLKHAIQTAINLGLGTSSEVLFEGCSAGGAAVVANADFVKSLMPPSVTKFKAHCDAGFFYETTPLGVVANPSMQGYFQLGAPLWGGIPNDNCTKALGNDGQWKCYMGQYAVPFITTPTLFHLETEDFAQLMINGVMAPWTRDKMVYLNDWRANVTRTLAQVAAPHAVYAPACFWHCSSEGEQFFDIKLANSGSSTGSSNADALVAFFINNLSFDVFDNCGGYSCSTKCPDMSSQQIQMSTLSAAML